MIKGFKDFIMRGNVIDLAVAFVLGVAFAAVVTSFTANIINPIVAALGGGNVNGLAVQLNSDNPKTVMDFGAFITSIIYFLIVAAAIYFFVVVPVNKLRARRRHGVGTEPDAVPEDVALLQEIRDLLRTRA